MATLTRLYTVDFGPARSGLATVGYRLTGSARVTAGVAELVSGSGIYAASVTHADDLVGTILWDAGTTPNAYAVESIDPGTPGPQGPAGTPGPAAGPAPTSGTAYCVDEDLAVWDPSDFTNLVPRSQVLACGADGSIEADEPWVLLCASVPDWSTRGVAAGCVVALTRPQASFGIIPGGELYGVADAAGAALTLRRLGRAAGVGHPPGGGVADLAGVEFCVRTFAPQIALSSADIRRQYRLDAAGRRPADLAEAGEELRQLATLMTLRRAYLTASKAKDGDYANKLMLITDALAQVHAKLALVFGDIDAPSAPPTSNLFSARARR